MRLRLATGTPLLDGEWTGAVVASVGHHVLAIRIGAIDVLDEGEWRFYSRAQCMLGRGGVAYVTHTKADRERIIRSWYLPCGSVVGCRCEAATQKRTVPFCIAPPRVGVSPGTTSLAPGRRSGACQGRMIVHSNSLPRPLSPQGGRNSDSAAAVYYRTGYSPP
jgi:hypothetical protein